MLAALVIIPTTMTEAEEMITHICLRSEEEEMAATCHGLLASEVDDELASSLTKDYKEERQGAKAMESVDFFDFRKR